MMGLCRLLTVLAIIAFCIAPAAPRAADVPLPLDDDELRLWKRSAEEEKTIDASGLVYRDRQLDDYLDGVVRKLVPADQLKKMPIRVSVIVNLQPNAFALPNGRIYIHSGLLTAIENEAQLAALLGHESEHVLGRHMLKELRNVKDKTALSATLGALTGNIILPFGQLGALAAIKGYSRELETDADTEGLRMLVQSGYDPAESRKLFAILQKEARDEKWKESYFFGSHPKLQDRIDNYDNLLDTVYRDNKGGITEAVTFQRNISPLLLDTSRLELKAGRIETARKQLESYLAAKGESAGAYFLLGETYRQVGQKEGLARAKEYYLKATTLDPSYPDPYHYLGIAAYKLNERDLARQSLERYLALSPKAPDRGHIEVILKELR